MFQPDSSKEKGCCSTRPENKCCTDIFKKEKIYVFMMLIYEKRGGKTKRTVLLLLLFNMVLDSHGIILNCTIYRDVFHSRKSLYTSNDFIYLV